MPRDTKIQVQVAHSLSSSAVLLLPARIFSFFTFLSLSSAVHHRHILHQQYSPLDSVPRSTQSTDSPFSPPPPPPDYPFFPETSIPYPQPPPPPPPPPPNAPFASFPANISALTLPQAHKSSKGASSKIIAGAFAAIVAAVILVSVSIYLHLRKRRSREFSDSKSHRFDNCSSLHHNNSVNSSIGVIPKLQRPLQVSSEFLYLGTLVDSHGGFDNAVAHSDSFSNSSTAPTGSGFSNLRRMGSPELRPLPPLKGKNVHGNSGKCYCNEDDYDNDDLYSLKWSEGGRNNSIGTDSAVELEKIVKDCSSSSYSSSSSTSGSQLRSASVSISPPVSLSPERSRVKSSESDPVQLSPPPLPPSLPVIPSELFPISSLINLEEPPSPSLSPSHFPSQPSIASPAKVDSRSRASSPRISSFSVHDLDTPLKISSPDHQNVHISVPSPPPRPPAYPLHLSPPLAPYHCAINTEILKTPPKVDTGLVFNPPVLATPVRPSPVVIHTFISPTQNNERILDSNEKTNDNAEKNMGNPYLKMEPLQWDKVTANSDGK